MLTSTELTALRSTLTGSLPDQCTITTVALVADGAGGHTETTSTATVACRLSPASGRGVGSEDTVGGRVTPLANWTISLPHGTNVTERSRITTGGRTFEVIDVGPRSWNLYVRAGCVEVQ